ncbi:MAG: selenium cofactor biosynthesis protein YqeC, partial [Halobacteria archaeon]
SPVVYSSISDGKIIGIDENSVELLSSISSIVLVEADGARGMSFKHPRAHEPVVPECSKKVVIVIGLDAFNSKIEDVCFHHEQISGYFKDGILDMSSLRKVLYSEDGYLKCKKEKRKFFLAVNKSDITREQTDAYLQCKMLYHPSIDKILLTSTKENKAKIVNNMEDSICGIVLAAGMSKRFGENKLIAKINSKPILQHVINACEKSKLDRIYIVVGHEAEKVISQMKVSRAEFVKNEDYELGMSTSLICGLRKAEGLDAGLGASLDAVMFILGDQPFITSEIIDSLIEKYRKSCAQICVPYCKGIRRNPVIFSKPMFNKLFMLKGDKGARDVVEMNRELTCIAEFDSDINFMDIDTSSELRKINYGGM